MNRPDDIAKAEGEVTLRRVYRRADDATRERHRAIREAVEREKPELTRRALEHKAEFEALIDATHLLKRERESRGVTLAEVARRSGLEEDYLTQLESDPFPHPTLLTLTRIATALGVRLTIGVADEAA